MLMAVTLEGVGTARASGASWDEDESGKTNVVRA